MNRLMTLAAVAAMGFGAVADPFEVRVWRGETTVVRIPDFTESVLGQPGRPGAVPVDWDGLIPVTERDGVEWYIVECSKHFEDLSAVLPSYNFLKSKGLGA